MPSVMTCLAVTLLIGATTTPVRADGDLRAVIKSPAATPPGRLVRLEARLVREQGHLREELSQESGVVAAQFAWRLVTPPDGYDITEWTFDDGRTVVFAAAEPGHYRFVLAAAVPATSANAQPLLFLAEHTLVVGQPSDPINPDPLPFPRPEPTLPVGVFGLARTTYELAAAEVSAPDRFAGVRLAENYRAIASRIVAGTLTDPEEILAATAEGNRSALAERANAWQPFFTALAARMKAIDAAGRLSKPADYAAAWDEIAAGLNATR